MSGATVAVFDFDLWQARYPELAGIGEPLAGALFTEAGLYLDNTQASVVTDITARGLILNMITAHLAAMNLRSQAEGATPGALVGRISNASEGTVSVQTAMDAIPGTAAWWMMTRYGASAYQALAPYRTARYIIGPRAYPRYGFGGLPCRLM